MIKKHMLLRHTSKSELRKKQRAFVSVIPEEKQLLKQILKKKTITGWHDPLLYTVKAQHIKRANVITFQGRIEDQQIKEGFTQLYDTIVKYAVPTMPYPTFHETVLSTIDDKSVRVPSIFKTASVAAFYALNTLNARRSGGFKNIPLEPYLINLFYRAFTKNDNSLMYCFVYVVLSWVNTCSRTALQDKHMDAIQTPMDPSFGLYYRLIDLLEIVPRVDLYTIQSFLMFTKVSRLDRTSVTALITLFDANRDFEHFLRVNALDARHDTDRIKEMWHHDEFSAESITTLHYLFKEHHIVYGICDLITDQRIALPEGGALYFRDIAEHMGEHTVCEIVYACYVMFLSPEMDSETAYYLLRGFRHDVLATSKIKKCKVLRQQPQIRTDDARSYNDCVRVPRQEQQEQRHFHALPLEDFIEYLENKVIVERLNPVSVPSKKRQYLTDIYDKSSFYFSKGVDLPIYGSTRGVVLTLKETFFLPI